MQDHVVVLSASNKTPSPLVSRAAAAAYLGIQPQTLALWHCTKRVLIPVVKIGSRVFYRKADLDAFIDTHVVGNVASAKGGHHVSR